MKASLSYPCSALIGLAQCRPIMAGDAAECTFFEKKLMIYLVGTKKRRTFALAFHKKGVRDIGVWCNGNTTDSGPVILGSSPSTPTRKSRRMVEVQLPGGFSFGPFPLRCWV